MKNGCTIAALISAMLNIINEVTQQNGSDATHTAIAIILAVATLIAIWRIDTKNNHGRR